MCRLHKEQDFWADYVAATWQLSCADCTSAQCLVQTARTVSSCADCTRNKIFGQTTWQLRGSFRVQSAQATGCACAVCTRNKILGRLRGIDVASTWHRRGNCRSQNVVQLQASTRLKTVSRERAHRLTPKRSLDTLRANCTKSYSQEVTSLFPGGGFLPPRGNL